MADCSDGVVTVASSTVATTTSGQPRRESPLEKYISDFVLHHTAERVDLLLNDAITVRPLRKNGSVLLAVFWANVLQRESKFPTHQFRYNKFPGGPEVEEKLQVKVNAEVSLAVQMKSGRLRITGKYIYEWFTRNFQNLLDNYDPEFANTWSFKPSPVKVFPEKESAPSNQYYTETERYLMMRQRTNPVDADLDRKLLEGDEDWIQKQGNLNMDMTLWEGEVLEEKLSAVANGAVEDGFTFVFKLCLSLLTKWFKTPGVKVYVACPLLDLTLLSDVVRLYLRNAHSANITAIYTRVQCDSSSNLTITDVKKRCMDTFDPALHDLILYKIFRNIFYPSVHLNATFIAGIHDGDTAGEEKTETEVLMTSASFHSDHMRANNAQTVQYAKLSSQEFHAKFIDPLFVKSVVGTEY